MVVFCALCALGRLFQFQIINHREWYGLALRQQERPIEIQAPRGTIFDRTGQPLAISIPVDSVCVNPRLLKDVSVASDLLAGTLHMDREKLSQRMRAHRCLVCHVQPDAADDSSGFMWVKRKITPQESRSLRSLRLDWVEFRQESQRFYPKGTLAAHLLGAVDFKESGNLGLELSLDKDLRGHAGAGTMLSDVRNRGIESQVLTEPRIGESITITIDERLQHVAERELADAVTSNNCKTGSIVAMSPYTGEILAMASYPTFNPNDPAPPGRDPSRFNLAVSAPFEPGSVFKVITLSAALETTNLTPDTIINCGNGRIALPGRVVKDHDSYVALSMADVLAKSSNIGAIRIGLTVGPEHMAEYIRRFGFGKATGIPLPAESRGRNLDLARLKDQIVSSVASASMGHQVSTTSLQLARACAVIANGGLLVKPKLILQRGTPGRPVVQPAEQPERILKPETTVTMKQLMERVVLVGTGKRARLDGYTAGGKTGSAQIFDYETGHYTHKYNASFMGFAPLSNPAIVVIVTLNGASQYGGAVAAPVFQKVATEALRLLDVPKDLPDQLPYKKEDKPAPVNDLSIAGLSPSGPPLPDAPLGETAAAPRYGPITAEAAAATHAAALNVFGPKVPDLQGLTMRSVMAECLAKGLPVEVSGSGIARAQAPPPGTILPPGARVRVVFVR